ncbi:phage integrase N-terminal SAM-like domain-containing protein [Marinagarivorans algicola]|uniref:phage integrase N-terminal SAM-like domain-containing protein n=1 Tax=Marinagarivorans algicola TaxID=1513270 RepID=UPI0009E75E9D
MAHSPFLNDIHKHMVSHHYALRTIQTYTFWVKRYILFHQKQHPNTTARTGTRFNNHQA